MTETLKPLDDFVVKFTHEGATIIENRIRLLLRPAPRWLPEKVWRWMIRQSILIEETKLRP